jgi:hypothetical protein
MKHQSKFSPQQEHVEEQQANAKTGVEFAGSDELLRHDAAQTVVPPEIALRLQKSSGQITPPKSRSWWKNLFGGGK